MNILVTNDDGIQSDGIIRLAAAAKKHGEVWVIAPDSQRSAMSHCITLRTSIDVWPVDFPVSGVHAYATTGTPADCVRFGKSAIMDNAVDLVLSGVNYGYNCGSDLQYSATAGAALEAASAGIQAIAFSEHFCPEHSVTDAYLDSVLSELIPQKLPLNQMWNVNFPACKLSELKGILRERKVSTNAFYHDEYLVEEKLPNGGVRLRVNGTPNVNAPEDTDFKAILDNYISIGIVNNLS